MYSWITISIQECRALSNPSRSTLRAAREPRLVPRETEQALARRAALLQITPKTYCPSGRAAALREGLIASRGTREIICSSSRSRTERSSISGDVMLESNPTGHGDPGPELLSNQITAAAAVLLSKSVDKSEPDGYDIEHRHPHSQTDGSTIPTVRTGATARRR